MPNDWFAFKAFKIIQKHAGMRVSTDACLFGAWVKLENAHRVLDIGTGTGLLALMLAQRYAQLSIDAVELDEHACLDAALNFSTSSFSSRIALHHSDIRHFKPGDRYDALVCNPPFFEGDLPSTELKRKIARHAVEGLNRTGLLSAANRLLTEKGTLNIMLPEAAMEAITNDAALLGWKLQSICKVFNKPGSSPHVVFAVYKRGEASHYSEESIVIRNADGSYTAQFTALMFDFYLDKN